MLKGIPKTSVPDRGFTLVELIMVMAIIGILAAIALSSLGGARNKSADASIKSNLKQAQNQAQIFYDVGANTYAGVCNASKANRGLLEILQAAMRSYDGTTNVSSGAQAWNTGYCYSNTTQWVASIPLKASSVGSPVYWCVDGAGKSKEVTVSINAGATICP